MSLFSQTLKKEKKKTKKHHNHKPKQTNNNPNPQLEIKKTKNKSSYDNSRQKLQKGNRYGSRRLLKPQAPTSFPWRSRPEIAKPAPTRESAPAQPPRPRPAPTPARPGARPRPPPGSLPLRRSPRTGDSATSRGSSTGSTRRGPSRRRTCGCWAWRPTSWTGTGSWPGGGLSTRMSCPPWRRDGCRRPLAAARCGTRPNRTLSGLSEPRLERLPRRYGRATTFLTRATRPTRILGSLSSHMPRIVVIERSL